MHQKKSLAFITAVYWFILLYAILALLFWFRTLNEQNKQIAILKSNNQSSALVAKETALYKQRKTAQYMGEGITFLAVILVGAVFVYRATRKQIKLNAQQQNFLMAVTHELKTPIAITRLNLETLQKHHLEQDKQQKLIRNTIAEANRLNMLCNNILLTSQFEGSGYTSNIEQINLSLLVNNCVQSFAKRFTNRSFTSLINPNVFISGDVLLLEMLVNNLIENAVKYTTVTEAISIELQTTNKQVKLLVKDEGMGIADSEKKKVFDKFYRAHQNEATRKTKGTGLGLYLCKKIAQQHKAAINVTNNLPKGSIFTVAFNQ